MDTISLPYPADSILRPQLYGGGGGGGNSCRERGEAFEAALSEVWGGFFFSEIAYSPRVERHGEQQMDNISLPQCINTAVYTK